MKEQFIKKLNNRQWALYLYLKYQAEENNGWKKRIDILRDLSGHYRFNMDTDKKDLYYNKSAQLLTRDVREINKNGIIQKIIVSDAQKGLKLGTQEEVELSFERELMSILKKLKNYHIKVQKAKDNGQVRLTFDLERDYIEAFINDNNGENNNE
ncbi:MAG TPA: hypothetical protein GX708_02760 [Gallicola sp.]|nr:hypothetical protein [Gallicola sp.]